VNNSLPYPSPEDLLRRLVDETQSALRELIIREVKKHAAAAAVWAVRSVGETISERITALTDYIRSGRWITDSRCHTFDGGGGTSHFCIDIDTFLSRFRAAIKKAGADHNLDARAIAGAITWEYRENGFRGRMSDYLQAPLYRLLSDHVDADHQPGGGIGWGSVHTDAAREVIGETSLAELSRIRLQAASAIDLVAQIMSKRADSYLEKTGGIFIRDNPPAVALFFNTSSAFLERAARKRALNRCTPGLTIDLDVSQNPMASWVKQNLADLAEYQTPVSRPSGCYARSRG